MATDLIQFNSSEKDIDGNSVINSTITTTTTTTTTTTAAAAAGAAVLQESESGSIKPAATITLDNTVMQPRNEPSCNKEYITAVVKSTTNLDRNSTEILLSKENLHLFKPIHVPIDNILTFVPEKSFTHIKESIVGGYHADAIHDVPLTEEEESDHLSPLMMDNHTILEHQESFKSLRSLDLNEIPEFIPQQLPIQHQPPPPPPFIHSDTKDSINSVDSEVSALLDRRNSQESSNPSGYSSDGLSSDENAKDSGCDVKPPKSDQEIESEPVEPIEIPDDEMSEKIVIQVEFYFSNDSILKDAFLLKHVRRNKEGFVSLKLISSFKRVRQITKDWRVVGYAIKLKSKKVEVNDLGTKVRRLEPLPSFDETMPSRTVVATDLPFDKVTIEKVSDIFSKCGEIALIRILRPGGAIPADVRQFINKYPELHQQYCALVEFTESQYARNAMNVDQGMQIFEMVAPKKKTGKKATISKMVENYKYKSHNEMERSRGGNGIGGGLIEDYKFANFRRNNSGYFMKQQQHENSITHHICQQPRKYSYTNNDIIYNENNFNRRSSTCSNGSNTMDIGRKHSNCSDGYSSCTPSDSSRRASMCSDASRRQSNCSDIPYRRTSNCSDFCPCSRRTSQCSDVFRRISQCSDHSRRYSNGSINYERRMSNGSESMRRVSFDGECERKISNGSMGNGNGNSNNNNITGFEPYRKIINQNGQYSLERKCSNDSGYDRRLSNSSVISDYVSAPRYITHINNANKAEVVVRTPMGPDGSKGFSSRARKVGQVGVPV